MAKCAPIDLHRILELAPYKVLVSLPAEQERRANAERQFKEFGLNVEWKEPVKIENIDWAVLPAVYRTQPKYASQTLTLLELFEEAKRRNVEQFVHFEDDVVFHREFRAILPHIAVPGDWKFIYLGGRNWGPMKRVSQHIFKGHYIYDLHAIIVRTEIVDRIKSKLLDPKIKSHWADERIAYLHKRNPAYICRPNLVWQSAHPNDGGRLSNYNSDGSVVAGQGG